MMSPWSKRGRMKVMSVLNSRQDLMHHKRQFFLRQSLILICTYHPMIFFESFSIFIEEIILVVGRA